MVTRASTTQKPTAARRSVPRGTHDSCHRDSSSSPSSSGRERRRRGKNKMQQRIEALEERIATLMEIIAQLTSEASGGMVSSPLVFDLFCRDGDFDDVAVQTDISVDWSKPDIFVRLPQDMNTPAHADAAAGEGPPESHCLAISQKVHEPLADLTPTQCGPPPPAQGTRQALDHSHSEHRSTCGKDSLRDFNSHSLASLAQPVAVGATEVRLSETRADLDLTQCGQLPLVQSTRQALEVANSEHRSACASDKDSLRDFNSHNLARLARPVAVGANEMSFSETRADFDLSQCRQLLAQGTRQALDVDNSEHRSTSVMDSPKDFNSHNLASLAQPANEMSFSETCVDLDLSQCATHGPIAHEAPCEKSQVPSTSCVSQCGAEPQQAVSAYGGLRQAHDDDNSVHRSTQPKITEVGSEFHTEKGFSETCADLDLSQHAGIKSEHRVASSSEASALSFGPSAHELQKALEPQQTRFSGFIGAVTPQHSQDPAPTSERVKDFERTLVDIIDIFNRRRKVSNDVLESTATAIRGAAAMRGVDILDYRTFIHSRSLRLSAFIF